MRRFEEYPVWRLSHELVLDVYRATRSFPGEERFGLTVQLRRSAVSVPSNIAEGCARPAPSDFARFLDIAAGSANEVAYQLRLAGELGYLAPRTSEELQRKAQRIAAMLGGLRRHVRAVP